jgi:site-specific recombinase XerD
MNTNHNLQYNLYNFLPEFTAFLHSLRNNGKTYSTITIKNYLSDFRHFAGWLQFYLNSQLNTNLFKSVELFFSVLTSNVVDEYKQYLLDNHIPIKTINRRLSALRLFFSYCLSQHYVTSNPAKTISNISKLSRSVTSNKPAVYTISELTIQSYLSHLSNDNPDENIITETKNDLNEFNSIINSYT